MKKSTPKAYLMVLLMLSSLPGSAQIIITAENVPSPGTNYIKGIDDLPAGIDPGTPGTGKTWDFSPLIANEEIAYSYVTPLTTPHPDYFPDANLALHSSDTAYSYLYYDDNVYEMQGLVMLYQGQEYAFDYTPDLVLLDFPFTYGDHISQDYYFEWVYENNSDSVRFKDYVTRSVEADAFGTVILPGGSYDALRAKVIQLNKDSLWAQVLGNWMLVSVTVTTSNYYDWYTDASDVDISLVSFKYDETWTTLESAEFFKESYVGIKDNVDRTRIKVYPNPCDDRVYVSTPGLINANLQIISMTGNIIMEQGISPGKKEIDLHAISPGIYLCRIIDKNSVCLYNEKIVIR